MKDKPGSKTNKMGVSKGLAVSNSWSGYLGLGLSYCAVSVQQRFNYANNIVSSGVE